MRSNGGFVQPLLMIEQPRGGFAIDVDMMRDTARFVAGTGAMLAAQCDDLRASGGRDREGCGDDYHNFRVARVVLFDMK
jgi:hypothetical protein